ncbi:hypothetical protein ZWY2020_030226 [Hordeum vulgare]|nr:hypothetical protein ZWY2020_030226 [Hordeum vulgare]
MARQVFFAGAEQSRAEAAQQPKPRPKRLVVVFASRTTRWSEFIIWQTMMEWVLFSDPPAAGGRPALLRSPDPSQTHRRPRWWTLLPQQVLQCDSEEDECMYFILLTIVKVGARSPLSRGALQDTFRKGTLPDTPFQLEIDLMNEAWKLILIMVTELSGKSCFGGIGI